MSELPPLPPPSRREPPAGEPRDNVEDGLRLLALHGSLLEALTLRSPADFRSLAIGFHEVAHRLHQVLGAPEAVPPSLVTGLAPLLVPRLTRLRHHLRRRLARVREELPLRRVREMDPACLRVNARRPGRTLLEKAGPRQSLRAVARVERYDTSENRVLVATCIRLRRSAQLALQGKSWERVRQQPRALLLRALHRTASELVESEELRDVGLPRPGERPSNALLGDADYRAVWRALRMLRDEEERFEEEWRAMARLLDELLLVATWCRFDTYEGIEPLPGWVRTRHRREESGRFDTGGPRRWVRFGEERVEEWEARMEVGGVHVLHRVWTGAEPEARGIRISGSVEKVSRSEDGARLRVKLLSDGVVVKAPADRTLLPCAVSLLGTSGLMGPAKAVARIRNEVRGLVAISALDATLRIVDDEGSFEAGPSAVADIPVEGESPLWVTGRTATLVTGGVAGPLALHQEQAEWCGHLLQAWRQRDVKEFAVVVPDRSDEELLRRLRTHIGACWAVWQPVAVALHLGEHEPQLVTPSLGESKRVLVIALSEAANDVALLSCQGLPDGERVWLRERPGAELPSSERLRFESVEEERREALRAAWLRQPGGDRVWAREREGWRLVASPRPGERLAEVVQAAAVALAREGVDVVAVAGASPELAERLRHALAAWPVPVCVLPADAAVRGARLFLERYQAERPTWRDRLPSLQVEVREGGRQRKHVDIVPMDEYAEPGRSLSFDSKQTLTLEAGRDAFDLRLLRDGQAAPFRLRLEGPPLPLSRPTEVRVIVRFRYGLQGVEGKLVPIASASFEHIPFRLQGKASEIEDTETVAAPPEYRTPAPLESEALARIEAAIDALPAWWGNVPMAQRKKAKDTPGLLDKELLPHLEELDEALRAVQGTGARSLNQDGRRLLEAEVAPRLDWLLGLRKSPERKDGDAPALADKALSRAVRARARAGVRGDGCFTRFLVKKLKEGKGGARGLWWWALGRVVDGRPDDVWDVLVGTEPTNDEERRMLGDAILWSCQAHPDAALHLGEARVRMTLGALRRALERLEPKEERRDHFALLFQCMCHLCRCRSSTSLPPGDDLVVETVAFLRGLRERLPAKVLGQAVRSSAQDEPLSMAIDALEGRSVTLPLAGRES